MSHEPKFCALCGFMDDGTFEANALSIDGRCPFCEQAYRRGREDAAQAVEVAWSEPMTRDAYDFADWPTITIAAARGDAGCQHDWQHLKGEKCPTCRRCGAARGDGEQE